MTTTKQARALYARRYSKRNDQGRRVWDAERPSFRAWARAHAPIKRARGKLARIAGF